MPRTKRQNILLKHDQTLRAIEKAATYMSELHDMFSEYHPEYSRGYENILIILATAHEFVEKMREFV